uniref:uncharacterized protein LOC122586089 n=1 Tax=Erigeron canadensis TaxID=72917 RepID=UPI001CB97F3F|nr:uncharacterized protein LOC122586089 [Erigeron canadensis]
MGSQVIINIINIPNIYESMILPAVVKTKLPDKCPSFKIVDYKQTTYEICLQVMLDGCLRLFGDEWTTFVQTLNLHEIETLCFTHHVGIVFIIHVFDKNGLEVHTYPGGTYIPACLVKATYESYDKQILPHQFLLELPLREDQTENKTARLLGGNQDVVQVEYVPHAENEPEMKGDEHGIAHAFVGSQWKIFASQNNVENNCWLPFQKQIQTRKYRVVYGVTVFNKYGISLHTGPSKRCNHPLHNHNRINPYFYQRLTVSTLATRALKIPSKFISNQKLHMYREARILYRHMLFKASVKRKPETTENKNSQLHLISDWKTFTEQTGILSGKKLRFELLQEFCIQNERLCFQLC